MAVTKNNKQVRVNAGNNVEIYNGTTWISLGNVVSGKLTKKGDTVNIQWMDGSKFKKRSACESGIMLVIGQMKKEIHDDIDGLIGKSVKLYVDNGIDSENYYMDIYAPECEIIDAFDIELKGSSHQVMGVELSFCPQSAIVSPTPSTDLPTDAHSHATVTAVTGSNIYYALIETLKT